ncbi:hypothetical protein F4818DRAFT_435909 [Hypoxylon cercidicola]|nr:hypothetical protein F4818DRAFT_435909 [Hypoxylon cercidicola]
MVTKAGSTSSCYYVMNGLVGAACPDFDKWGKADDDTPDYPRAITHLVVMFLIGYVGAEIGSLGDWIVVLMLTIRSADIFMVELTVAFF